MTWFAASTLPNILNKMGKIRRRNCNDQNIYIMCEYYQILTKCNLYPIQFLVMYISLSNPEKLINPSLFTTTIFFLFMLLYRKCYCYHNNNLVFVVKTKEKLFFVNKKWH